MKDEREDEHGWPELADPEEDEADGLEDEEPEDDERGDEEPEAAEDEPLDQHAPGDLRIPAGVAVVEGEGRDGVRAVGIVVSRYNGEVTSKLLERAMEELEAEGVGRASVTVMPVPGAFELPLAAMALAKTRRFSCIVALGCVIRGETPHFDFVAGEAASGLLLAALETGVPVSFGLLTVDTAEQAEARVDRAADAVRSALEMADSFAELRASVG